AVQATFGGGDLDAFVTVLNASGSGLIFSTFLGGSASDYAAGIALDNAAHAYVVGATNSTDFPTVSPVQSGSQGAADAFVARLDVIGVGPQPAPSNLQMTLSIGQNSTVTATGSFVDPEPGITH